MFNTGWAKSRRAFDCFFIFMTEILGGYWQILDRSGKKIILLSPLVTTETAFVFFIFLLRFSPEWPIRTCSKITAVLLLCTDDDNRSYRNVCNMSFVSFALAVIFIIRLFITSAFRVPRHTFFMNVYWNYYIPVMYSMCSLPQFVEGSLGSWGPRLKPI